MIVYRSLSIFSLLVLFAILAAIPALAQPSNTCDGNENLDGMDTLPQTLNLPAASLTDTFTMSGGGCFEQAGDDMVVCFTPQNSCSVNISCFYTPAAGGLTGTNLFQGPCSTNPPTCISSTSASGMAATISGASLTAGTQYCVVCSNNFALTSLDVSITVAQGDCGALPVELQHFSIDSPEAVEVGP